MRRSSREKPAEELALFPRRVGVEKAGGCGGIINPEIEETLKLRLDSFADVHFVTSASEAGARSVNTCGGRCKWVRCDVFLGFGGIE